MKFEKPELEILEFEMETVIATSGLGVETDPEKIPTIPGTGDF